VTEYLKALYEASLLEKKTKLTLFYHSIFFSVLIQLVILVAFEQVRIFIIVSFIVSILILSLIDQKIEHNSQRMKKKKEKFFYEIFYAEMLSSIMNITLKTDRHHHQYWPHQTHYLNKMTHVTSEHVDLILYQFKIHEHQNPLMKVFFKFPCKFLTFQYLNHKEALEMPVTMFHHHYLYQLQEKNHAIMQYIEIIERCPNLLDVEIIFNGQDAMFMCKIDDVTIIHDFKLKEKTFKRHQTSLSHIYPVYQYLKESLEEFEDAYRK